MKRTGRNSLVGGIVALSLVLAGTGYAYWTDTLQLTTKATTGDFEVQFVDLGLYAQYGGNEVKPGGWSIVDGIDHGATKNYVADDFFRRGATDYNKIAKDGSIEQYKAEAADYNSVDFDAKLVDAKPIKKPVGPYNAARANGSDKIELTINKMYPGYAQAFRSDILNVGDIAAQLSDLKFDVHHYGNNVEKGNLEKMLGVAILINGEQYHPETANKEYNVFKLAKALNLPEEDFFKVGQVDFVRLSALKDANIKAALENNIILNSHMQDGKTTDNRMDIFVGIAMDPDAKGVYTTGTTENMTDKDDRKSQDKGIKLDVKFLWDQFNVGKDAPNGNVLIEQNK